MGNSMVEHRPETPGAEGTQIASDGAPRVSSPRWDHGVTTVPPNILGWMVYNGKYIYKSNHSYISIIFEPSRDFICTYFMGYPNSWMVWKGQNHL